MKGTDLEAWCKDQGSAQHCSECLCKKQCDKWKELKTNLADLEPWEMDKFKKLTSYLIDGYDFKFGREI